MEHFNRFSYLRRVDSNSDMSSFYSNEDGYVEGRPDSSVSETQGAEHDPNDAESSITTIHSAWENSSQRLPQNFLEFVETWTHRAQSDSSPSSDDDEDDDNNDDDDDDDDDDDEDITSFEDSSSSSDSDISSDLDVENSEDSQDSMSLDSQEDLDRRQRSVNGRLEQLTDQYRHDVQQLMDQVQNVMRSISTTPETARRTQEIVLMMSGAITDILLEQQQESSREARRGTCPDYLERLPRSVLKDESPIFFSVQLRLVGSNSIKGRFLTTGSALKEGNHKVSVVESRKVGGNVAILLRGEQNVVKRYSPFRRKQQVTEQLGSPVLYSWVTDSITMDSSHAILVGHTQKPVIYVKHEDAITLSNAIGVTDSCEILVEKEVPTCAVCAEDFEVGHNVLCLPNCGHYYHQDCVLPWLRCHNTCPTCRDKLPRPQQNRGSS